MSITNVSRPTLYLVLTLIVLAAPSLSSAQDLVVARAESLNALFEDVEAIAGAVGQPITKQAILGMAGGAFGFDPGSFLDMDRPVAALMPVEGMMMMQNGVVVAVPVTDAAAAIEAMVSMFPNHSVEDGLHTFSGEEQPSLYAKEADGYLRVGGSALLVSRFDPLASAATGSALSVELFLEPIAPMIEANLDMAKTQIMSGVESQVEGDTEAPFDPAEMEPIFDTYFDGIRWLLANTSSVRLRLDVDQGHLFFAKDLVPVAESDLAGFIKAQKGGLPEIAKLVDENAAWYMAGSLDLSDELRQGLKTFTQEYMKIVSSALASQTGTAEDEQAEMVQTWDRFTAVFGPFSDRWIDCLRGDVAASFSLPAGEPFRFTEAFGLVDAEECGTLVNELADEFAKAIGDNAELAQSITLAEGPEIGGGESLVMTVDIVKMLDEVGPAGEEDAEAIITSMYGESFSGAVVAAGDVMLAAGGPDAPGDLAGLAAALKAPGKAPSFAPLEIRPGMMFAMNIGALMSWMQNAVPEGEVEFVDVAERLSGESGRIPMAVTFSSGMATFDIAVSLETIGTVAAIVQEQEAQRAPAAEDQAESAED